MIFGNFAGAMSLGATASAKAAAQALQAAIATLGKVVNSAKLKIKADGVIGPATAAAVNWAFTNHIGKGQAPAQYRTGKLTVAQIQAEAATLASLVQTEIARRGAKAASPATVQKAQAAGPVSKADVKRLQQALVNLGSAAGSLKLTVKGIGGINGVLGAKTVAAVNLAFTSHIGAGQAPAQLRTGQLTLADVKANIATLIGLIEKEATRRAAKAGAIVTPAGPVSVSKVEAKRLQQAIVNLHKVAKSKQKAIAVDGDIGAETVAAVNWSFTNHIGAGQAPAQYRTGRLTLNDVKAHAAALAQLAENEVKRRGGVPLKAVSKKKVARSTPVTQATVTQTSTGKVVTTQQMVTPEGNTETIVTDTATGDTYKEDPGAAGTGVAYVPGSSDTVPDMGPSGSVFDRYKWPIVGAGALAVVGLGAMIVFKKKQGASGDGGVKRLPARRR